MKRTVNPPTISRWTNGLGYFTSDTRSPPKNLMETWYPIWDRAATRILTDENGEEIWMHESDVTRNISRQMLGVWRPRNSRPQERRIVLKVPEEEIFERKLRRLDSAQPFCISVKIGDSFHGYMHHRERCQASYDGRSLYTGTDGRGNPVFLTPTISGACL